MKRNGHGPWVFKVRPINARNKTAGDLIRFIEENGPDDVWFTEPLGGISSVFILGKVHGKPAGRRLGVRPQELVCGDSTVPLMQMYLRVDAGVSTRKLQSMLRQVL